MMTFSTIAFFLSGHSIRHKAFFLGILFWGILSTLSAQHTSTDSLHRLQLFFAGDIMGHGPQIKSAQLVKNESYDYTPCFRYVGPIIKQADLAIGNLEVTLPGKPPYRGYPLFRSPDALASALRLAGFDFLATSNNHSNDGGKNGVIHTIDALRQQHFYQTGTFKNSEERDIFYPLIVYKNQFKLAFLNYTYDTNKIPTRPPTMVNEIDTALIRKDMQEAVKLQPDLIIVLMHWGLEYQLKESKKQRRLANWLFRQGADLIIGSHPHVVQPIKEQEVSIGEERKKVLVSYSLGNFISNQQKPNTDGGLALEVELLKHKRTGETTIGKYEYLPIWRYVHSDKKGKKTFFALPVSAFEEKLSPECQPKTEKRCCNSPKTFGRTWGRREKENWEMKRL